MANQEILTSSVTMFIHRGGSSPVGLDAPAKRRTREHWDPGARIGPDRGGARPGPSEKRN
jgi:hypothetical protein